MLKIEQAHDHRVLRITALGSNPAYGSRRGLGKAILAGVVGVALSLGVLVMGVLYDSLPRLDSVQTKVAVSLCTLGIGLVVLMGVTMDQLGRRRSGPAVLLRVGASWLRVDDGPRVAFDTVTLLQTEPGVLVIASAHTATVPDPDGEVHDELSRALDAWTLENADVDGSIAAQEQKRLQSLTRDAGGS